VQRWNIEEPGPAFDSRFGAVAAVLGLQIRRTSLKSLAPNVHWHLAAPDRTGTLEATWLIDADEAWLCVRDNRRAKWVDPMAAAILKLLRSVRDP
jgi:hypothetical protein